MVSPRRGAVSYERGTPVGLALLLQASESRVLWVQGYLAHKKLIRGGGYTRGIAAGLAQGVSARNRPEGTRETPGLGFVVQGFGCRVWGLGVVVWDLGFRGWGFRSGI